MDQYRFQTVDFSIKNVKYKIFVPDISLGFENVRRKHNLNNAQIQNTF